MRITMLIAGVAFCAGAVAAPNLEAAMASCASQSDAAARLACYDAVAARMKTAAEAVASSPPAAAVTTPAAPAVVADAPKPQTATGFGGEHIKDPAHDDVIPAEDVEEIHAKVTAVTFAANGRFTVTLDNGQVWRQTQGETERFRFSKTGGDAVTISRGFWHSYNLVLDDGAGPYKVVRDK
jgi:hypothetical protein